MATELISNLVSIIFSSLREEVFDTFKYDYLKKVAAEKAEQKLVDRIRIENDPFNAEMIDHFLAEEHSYLSHLLSPDLPMDQMLLENTRKNFRKKYPRVEISDQQFLEYVKQARSDVLQLLSPDFRVLYQSLEHIRAEIQRGEKNTLEKLDDIIKQQGRPPLVDSNSSSSIAVPFPTFSMLIQQPCQYLTHMLTLQDGTRYILSSTTIANGYADTLSKFLQQDSHFCIHANGGVGKTTFLQNVAAIYRAGPVYLAHLNYLVYPEKLRHMPLDQGDKTSSGIFMAIENIDNSTDSVYQKFLTDLNSRNTLLLLDGLNELSANYQSLFSRELTKILQCPCKVLVTTRNLSSLPPDAPFCLAQLSAVDDRIKALQKKIGKEYNPYLCNLIATPLYYSIVQRLMDRGECDFSQLTNKFRVIDTLFKNSLNHAIVKLSVNTDRQIYAAAISIVFPWLVYRLAHENRIWLSQLGNFLVNEISAFLDTINSSEYSFDDFDSECRHSACRGMNSNELYRLLKQCGAGKIEDYIQDFLNLLQPNGKLHQDILDYIVAVYFKRRLDILEENFQTTRPTSKLENRTDYVLDSFDSSTIEFILCAVLESENRGKIGYFSAFRYRFSTQRFLDRTLPSIARFLMWCEAAIQLGENLMKEAKDCPDREKAFEAYSNVIEGFLMLCGRNTFVMGPLTTADRIRLNKVLLKGAEQRRRKNKFSCAISMARLSQHNASLIVDQEISERHNLYAQYHIARILLREAQFSTEEKGNPFTKKNFLLAQAQIKCLDICATKHYIYAVQLMGLFYSFPAPFIRPLIEQIDYPKAFWYYYNEVFGSDTFHYKKHIAAQPIRSCVTLLLFGLVHVDIQNPENYTNIHRNRLTVGIPGQPNESDLALAEQILALLQATQVPLRFVYRGLIAFYREQWSKALQNFSLEKDEHLAMVAVYKLLREQKITEQQVMKYGFSPKALPIDIQKKISRFLAEVSCPCSFDRLHPQYLLEQIYWIDPYWKSQQ